MRAPSGFTNHDYYSTIYTYSIYYTYTYGVTTAKKPDPAKHVTFSLSFDDTERIKAQRHRLSSKERALNASEVVRLALLVLSQEEPAAIDPVLKRLTRFKPGRPTKAKARRR